MSLNSRIIFNSDSRDTPLYTIMSIDKPELRPVIAISLYVAASKNRPYIQLQLNGGELGKMYEDSGFQSFTSTGDIYCLFYERGHQLLKADGHLCYITSNKWMRAAYGEKLRTFLASKTNPLLLIDFAGVKVFESATVDTNILLFEKAKNAHHTICAATSKQNRDSLKNLSVFVQQQGTFCDFSGGDSWVILSPIEQSIKKKIEAVGTPLKDWDININRGVLTGYNDAFIITTSKRDEILSNCQNEDERKRTAELIRRISYHDVKAGRYTKHPLRVKEGCEAVLVEHIP